MCRSYIFRLERVIGRASAWLLCGVLLVTAASPAHAQNYPAVAPHVPPAEATGTITPPPAKKQTDNSDQVLMPSLEAVILVNAPGKVIPDGIAAHGVIIQDITLLNKPDIKERIGTFLHKPLTPHQMQTLSSVITNWYRTQDHPLVNVTFPEQDLSKNTLQVLVMEFHAGAIKVEGNKWFSSGQIAGGLRVKPGDAIDMTSLQEDVTWLNDNPFRHVDVFFEEGDATGTTNIDLKTQDQFPVKVYTGYSNTGAPNIGRSQWDAGGSWGNAFGLGQIVSYQFTSTDDFWLNGGDFLRYPSAANYNAHSVDDIIPLPWHDKIDIFGVYTQERPDVGADFNELGTSEQASIRYIHPLPTLSWLKEEVQAGYDFKKSNNNLEFGGTQVYRSSTQIDQFLLVYQGTQTDALGQTTLLNNFVFSPGGLTAGNNSASFQQSGVAHASADYLYDNINVTRAISLPASTSSVTRISGQLSNGNLLPSEELGAGGESSVRGYDTRVANGSQGILISEELRSPGFDLSQSLFHHDIHDQTQLLTFWDYGHVTNNNPLPSTTPATNLESVGVGMRESIGSAFTLQADYGWQLLRLPGETTLGEMGTVSLSITY